MSDREYEVKFFQTHLTDVLLFILKMHACVLKEEGYFIRFQWTLKLCQYNPFIIKGLLHTFADGVIGL